MKKFGFGKKSDGDEDPNRLALFGSKSKGKSPTPTPSANNPYAQNPYAQPQNSSIPPDPYTQAKMKVYAPESQTGYPVQDNRYGADSRGPMDNKNGSANGNGGRHGTPQNGYAGGGYGAQGGYGTDRYGNAAATQSQNTASRYGAGGYGGMGGAGAYDDDADDMRDTLFGGAKDRLKQKGPQSGSSGQQPPPYEEGSAMGGSSVGQSQGYQPYQERQLTAEEEEDEDVRATKNEMRFMKQGDVSSTRNALRMAQEAEETGRDTLARLGAQGEHIHNTEKNLDLSHNQNRLAEDKAKELKKLNSSMFAVHVANPFTAGSRREARDQAVLDKHLDQRDQREATRREAYQSHQRLHQTFKELQPGTPGYGQARGANLADRAKYQFEPDSDDEEMENEIDSNLDALGGAAGRLNALARATGREVDAQNQLLDRIADKTDRVDIGIASNRAKLDRIAR
ncbi:Protein transport protein S9 plasma membrane t-SNARE [Ptychographa xylographoides]|nr:Protein transport protein S9 plasma membrane t-SNARE [Ptychographa xylographoides]